MSVPQTDREWVDQAIKTHYDKTGSTAGSWWMSADRGTFHRRAAAELQRMRNSRHGAVETKVNE